MTETAARHKHRFPCNPPGGTFLRPGPCECGKTYDQNTADGLLTEALEAITIAYGVPPRVREDWAVHWGSEDLNGGKGYVDIYDDEEDARDHQDLFRDSSVVKRTVIALRWERVPGEVTP